MSPSGPVTPTGTRGGTTGAGPGDGGAGAAPGSSHHAGRLMLCRPAWRVPWLAPVRVVLLLLVAAAGKVVADLNVGSRTLQRVATDVQWPALLLALVILVHPLVIRHLFRRVRTGVPVTAAWAGRDRSGQPWLVLRSPSGRAWRVKPRPGPVDYPLPRWRGTPWIYPPAYDGVLVSGTLVRPWCTRRRGLVLHRADGMGFDHADAPDVLAFGSEPAHCHGLHLRSVRRLRDRS